jgi:hypothetical protein
MEHTPTTEEWAALYRQAMRMYELMPWSWLRSTDIFGISNPERPTETVYFSALSAGNDYRAIDLYLGEQALTDFLMIDQEEDPLGQRLTEVRELHLFYDRKTELRPEDREIIRAVKYRPKGLGPFAYPMFRSYLPARSPAILNAEEVRLFTFILEKAQEWLPEFNEHREVLQPEVRLENEFLVMKYARKYRTSERYWREIYRIPIFYRGDYGLHVEPVLLEQLAPYTEPVEVEDLSEEQWWKDEDYPEVKPSMLRHAIAEREDSHLRRLEIELVLLPYRLPDDLRTRITYAYCLLVVDAASGEVLLEEYLQPEPDLHSLRASVPERVLRLLAREKFVPGRIAVRRGWLPWMLDPVARALFIQLEEKAPLPAIKPHKERVRQCAAEKLETETE